MAATKRRPFASLSATCVVALLCALPPSIAAAQNPPYSSDGLREMVAKAALENGRMPQALRGYSATVESETAFIFIDSAGRENVISVEQVAARYDWSAVDGARLKILGMRKRTTPLLPPLLNSDAPLPFPVLYGERFGVGGMIQDPLWTESSSRRKALMAVHPLSADRERYYRFSGGDNRVVIGTDGRQIEIVSVRVQPTIPAGDSLLLFDGEMFLDVTRFHVVRLRVRMLGGMLEDRTVGPGEAALGLHTPGYVDLQASELDGLLWIPTRQRQEFQLGWAWVGPGRAILRNETRLRDVTVGDRRDSIGAFPESHVTTATPDELRDYSAWFRELGDMTGEGSARDFDDLAPDFWRATGPPRTTFFPTRRGRTLRFNRVEGLFTGLEASTDFRDFLPGVSAQVFAGWAWTEQTVRGGLTTSLRRPHYAIGLRAERALVSTNDFPSGDPSSSWSVSTGDPGFGAFFLSMDDRDYVDRSMIAFWTSRFVGRHGTDALTLQLQAGRDRSEDARMMHSLFSKSARFLPNRGAEDGTYVRGSIDYALNPERNALNSLSGADLQLHYEHAEGELAWQRAEIVLGTRTYYGPLMLSTRLNAGALVGAPIPPQQLFELGGTETLPGYGYKAFVGDRAAIGRVYVNFGLPVLRESFRLHGRRIPAPNPGIGAGFQAGWAELSTAAAALAANALTAQFPDLPHPTATDGVRGTIGAGLTFFGGFVRFGVSRPIDGSGSWRTGFGSGFVF